MVDATRRKLKVPPRFVPYMETHRVYELFHDLASELVKKQPIDHIMYLKEKLPFLRLARDRPRIVILAPPQIDRALLCLQIAEKTGVTLVQSNMISEAADEDEAHLELGRDSLARSARKFLRDTDVGETGWILADFPTTPAEALDLQVQGILPTHTFQLIPSDGQEPAEQVDPVVICPKNVSTADEILTLRLQAYNRHLPGLRQAYQSTLREIQVEGRDMIELAGECAKLSAEGIHHKPLMLPRILILGLRGSGKNTQARLLCDRFDLVHVDLNVLLAQTLQQPSETAERLESLALHRIEISSDLLKDIIEKRILRSDCLAQGWVMTGYPRNMSDLTLLQEQSSTPPNRIFFINTPYGECARRITGNENGPRDHPEVLLKDLRTGSLDLAAMKSYIGAEAIQVDGSRSERQVFELVSGHIMRPAPTGQPALNIDRTTQCEL